MYKFVTKNYHSPTLWRPIGGHYNPENWPEWENKIIHSKCGINMLSEDNNSLQNIQQDISFATLFRNSKFVQMGDPKGSVIVGKIYHVIKDYIWIDFGAKFPCVCRIPTVNTDQYRRNVQVLIRLQDLELSSRFLGSDKDLTLLEADATLLGLYKTGERKRNMSRDDNGNSSPFITSRRNRFGRISRSTPIQNSLINTKSRDQDQFLSDFVIEKYD